MIDLIPYEKFGALRLRQFCQLPFSPATPQDPGHGRRLTGEVVAELVNWVYLERTWVGEAVGFAEWLRREDDPEVLRFISIPFGTLTDAEEARILETVRLPLAPGMNSSVIRHTLGSATESTKSLLREDLWFRLGRKEPYLVNCVVDPGTGLTYVSVMRADA